MNLRGINFQSRLLLHGSKTLDTRSYPLCHRGIGFADQETWLVETPGPVGSSSLNAIIDGENLGKRPLKAQFFGTITFSKSSQYKDASAFRADETAHRIREESAKYDWSGDGDRYAWKVVRVRALLYPKSALNMSMTGCGKREYFVEFVVPETVPAHVPRSLPAGVDSNNADAVVFCCGYVGRIFI